MSEQFSTNLESPVAAPAPERSAITRVDLRMLREFLRLPSTVRILGVRPDSDSQFAILELAGAGLPAGVDEVIVRFTFENHTIPKFDKFVAVPTCD